MGVAIGFQNFPLNWEGPVVLEFSHVHTHTQTARYKSRLESREFDLYAPLFLLKGVDTPPPRLLVALGRSAGCVHRIGFTGERLAPAISSDTCEFEYCERKVNTVLYCMRHDRQEYKLYVPNEIFAQDEPPARVFISIAIPGS